MAVTFKYVNLGHATRLKIRKFKNLSLGSSPPRPDRDAHILIKQLFFTGTESQLKSQRMMCSAFLYIKLHT